MFVENGRGGEIEKGEEGEGKNHPLKKKQNRKFNFFFYFLSLTVPPRWTIEPNSEISVERNRHVMLHCQAEGVPKPNIVWKKATSGIASFKKKISKF